MTNEQLAVLLQQYLDGLTGAIDEAREAVPDDAPREIRRILTPSGGLTAASNSILGQRANLVEGEHYRDEPGEYLCLVPLISLASRLEADIETLLVPTVRP